MAGEAKDKQTRIAAAVIIVTFPCWLGFSWLGGKIGLETRYAFLADLIAIAAFVWALLVLWQVRRARRQE